MPFRGMNVHELMTWDGLTREQAEHEMACRTFGVNYKLDKNGDPLEQGIGSAAQQTEQHKAAVNGTNPRVCGMPE